MSGEVSTSSLTGELGIMHECKEHPLQTQVLRHDYHHEQGR
jgi:hypothetical protein